MTGASAATFAVTPLEKQLYCGRTRDLYFVYAADSSADALAQYVADPHVEFPKADATTFAPATPEDRAAHAKQERKLETYKQGILALAQRWPAGTVLDELKVCRIVSGNDELWPYALGQQPYHPSYVALRQLQLDGVLRHHGHNGCVLVSDPNRLQSA